MDKEITIVSYAQSSYEHDCGCGREMMVLDVAKRALAAAGLKQSDNYSVVSANNDYCDGRTISNMRLVEVVGSWLKNESKVEMDGGYALLYAVMRILSGDHEVSLVLGESQANCYNWSLFPGIMLLDPTWDRQRWLLNEVSAAALMANAYVEAGGATVEQIAGVAAKNLANAALNPLAAQADAGADAAAVLASRKLYDPITEKMVAPLSDGCCAMVISNGKALQADKPVYVRGMGFSHDSYFTERDSLAELGSLERAAKACYAMAGIGPSDVQLAEVHENFAHEELMAYEALGFCGAGEGGAFFDSGATAISGKLPVNASGGGLSGNAVCATGLARVIEAAMQIRGEAGDHQVAGIKTAVATGQTGIGAQENVVFALGGE